jgi:HTH-type transcriptional regulator, competence development regulator
LPRGRIGKRRETDSITDDCIWRLAAALEADEDELLILAQKIPEQIRRRVLERPDAFRKVTRLDDEALDRLLAQIEEQP